MGVEEPIAVSRDARMFSDEGDRGGVFLNMDGALWRMWKEGRCGERLHAKQKKCEWIGGVSTKDTGFAQPVCGVVWKRWERMGGWEGMEGRFPFVRKGTGKI